MGLGTRKLEEDSPLDALANQESRVSVLSTASTGSGILDAFPLPQGIETQLHHASSSASLNRHVADFLNRERKQNSPSPHRPREASPEQTNNDYDNNDNNDEVGESRFDRRNRGENRKRFEPPPRLTPDPQMAIDSSLAAPSSVSAPGSATEPNFPSGRYPWDMRNPQSVSGPGLPTDDHLHTQNQQLERTQKRYLRYGKSFENSPGPAIPIQTSPGHAQHGYAFPGAPNPDHKFHRGHTHAASYSAYPGSMSPTHSMIPTVQQSATVDQSNVDQSNVNQHDMPRQGGVDGEEMLSRPQMTRSHSLSRSWDAGGSNSGFAFPSHEHQYSSAPLRLEPMQRFNSWQEHIEQGCNSLNANNRPNAYLHWSIAASPPWNSPIGNLLVQLGMMERWFSLNREPLHQYIPSMNKLILKSVNVTELKKLTSNISIQVRDALNNLGTALKRVQDNTNAAVAYEIAGALGCRDALLSAANIYYKGDKRMRDVAKAQKLYHRAEAL